MNWVIILHAGLATGTVLLFAAIGEIFAERSGILNLGVEGMMLLGAMAGFSVSLATGSPWIGLAAAMFAGGILSVAHGIVTIHFQADQVVSGLSLTFLGTGLALVCPDRRGNIRPRFYFCHFAKRPVPVEHLWQSVERCPQAVVGAGFVG